MNRVVANGPLETAGPPSNSLITFNYKERYARCESCSTIHQDLQNVRLRFLLVYLFNGGLDDRHVARRLSSRRFCSRQVNATFVCGAQVFLNGGSNAAIQ